MKADPGMGNTTLGKKITKDWGHRGVQEVFNHIFCSSETCKTR